MNVPNKITICRILLAIFLIVLLIFPVETLGFRFPEITIVKPGGAIFALSSKDLICGVIFLVASLTDFLDGYLARKYHIVTDLGKVMDAIADKILVNGVLIALACSHDISSVIPIVIVSRDIIVDSIKMVAGQKSGAIGASKAGKWKTAVMLTGITILFLNDLPFSLWNLNVSKVLILIATLLSVVSGIQYYHKNKKFIFDTK